MTRRAYFDLLMTQDAGWLMRCLDDPGPNLRSWHLALLRLAIRHKLGGA